MGLPGPTSMLEALEKTEQTRINADRDVKETRMQTDMMKAIADDKKDVAIHDADVRLDLGKTESNNRHDVAIEALATQKANFMEAMGVQREAIYSRAGTEWWKGINMVQMNADNNEAKVEGKQIEAEAKVAIASANAEVKEKELRVEKHHSDNQVRIEKFHANKDSEINTGNFRV